MNPEQKIKIEELLPEEQLRSFRSSYLEIAKQLKEKQQKEGDKADPNVQQLDFEFVLSASSVVDYDYIMALIAKYTQTKPSKQTMSREQLINLQVRSSMIQARIRLIRKEDLTNSCLHNFLIIRLISYNFLRPE